MNATPIDAPDDLCTCGHTRARHGSICHAIDHGSVCTCGAFKLDARRAFLHLDGWGGQTRQAVLVVGETDKRYRIRNGGENPLRLPGRFRHLEPQEQTLVPKHAITFEANERAAQRFSRENDR